MYFDKDSIYKHQAYNTKANINSRFKMRLLFKIYDYNREVYIFAARSKNKQGGYNINQHRLYANYIKSSHTRSAFIFRDTL